MSVIGSSLAIGSATVGVGLLRMSWSRRGGGRPWLTATGWVAFLGGAAAWHGAGLGWDEAVALGMLGPSLIAFLVLARYAQWRPTAAGAGRGPRRVSVKESASAGMPAPMATRVSVGTKATSGSGRALRIGAARALLAGPGALAAALGLTGLVALRMPWLEADRLVAAGLVLPVAWAVGAVWATMDRRLMRVAVGLCVTAMVCVGGAVA